MKTFNKLICLALSASLLSGCSIISNIINGGGQSSTSNNSSDNGSSSQGGNSSSTSSGGNSSSQGDDPVVKTGLDLLISQFVNGTGMEVPSLNEYNMDYELYFSYYYQQYVIGASVQTSQNLDIAYNSKFSGTNWVSWNDDYYTVEDYGYMWVDDEDNPTIEIYFSVNNGYFGIEIYRDDGKAGTADVSNVDTSWYVDYVREYGFEHGASFPQSDLKLFLGLDHDVVTPNQSHYAYGAVEAGYDEDDNYVPDTFYVVTENNIAASYASSLESAGYQVTEEDTYTIDWDALEVIDYKIYTAIDANHEVVVSFDDLSEPLMISYCAFDDLYVDVLTDNTDWTDTEKSTMNTYLGEVLPFVKMGDGYIVQQYSDTQNDSYLVAIMDNYYLDRTNVIIEALLSNGFIQVDDATNGTYYVKDNRIKYLEVFVSYDGGNQIVAYYSETQYVAATGITLDKTTISCVPGYSFDLIPTLEPANATSTVTYVSSSDTVEVTSAGHVTVTGDAVVGSTVTITATAEAGVTATCEIHVQNNTVTELTLNQNEAKAVAGKSITLTASLLPLGATGTIDWSSSNESIATVENGVVTINANAAVNSTVTITAAYHDNPTIKDTCVITVETVKVDVLNQSFFNLVDGNTDYATHNATGESGATYSAQCASAHGIQIRSKNGTSGILASLPTGSCKSISITFDSNTPNGKIVDVYASNTSFTIADMYGSTVTKVGSITYNSSSPTSTYEFTDEYSYVGIRSRDGAIYMTSLSFTW